MTETKCPNWLLFVPVLAEASDKSDGNSVLLDLSPTGPETGIGVGGIGDNVDRKLGFSSSSSLTTTPDAVKLFTARLLVT